MDAQRVLLRLRLVGFAGADRVATGTGLSPEAAGRALEALSERGWARFRDGRLAGVVSGWSLTPAGRAAVEDRLAAEIDGAGCRVAVDRGYRRFLELNRPLLEAVTQWQLRDGRLNDHTDPEHDQRVLTLITRINEKIGPVLADLADCLERYDGYRARLDGAIDRARRGETAFVDGALIDSYHTVWFELHEDLLATLGLDRSHEHAEPDENAEHEHDPDEAHDEHNDPDPEVA
jgi:hypothetical protein